MNNLATSLEKVAAALIANSSVFEHLDSVAGDGDLGITAGKIAEGATDPEDVLKVIDRLKTAVTSEPIVLEGKSVPLRSSMGGALCDWKETNSADIAKQAADKALYQDKESPARAEFKTVMAKISMEHTGAKAKGFRDDLTIPAEPAPPKPPKSSLTR